MPIWVPPTKKQNKQTNNKYKYKTKNKTNTTYHQNKYNTRKH